MKIDFNAAYSKISHILNRPESLSKELQSDQSFQKTLADISPQPISKTKETLGIEQNPSAMVDDLSEALARFSFDQMPLPSPTAEMLSPSETVGIENVKGPDGGVKTPTVVRVERVGGDELAALPIQQRMEQVKGLVSSYGRQHGVDPLLGMAVVSAESSFNPLAVSRDGHESKGLFQLLDSTGNDLKARASLSDSYDPFNPEQNVDLGVYYLRYLHDLFHSPTELTNNLSTIAAADSSSLEKLAVAAFNAGEGRVASAQSRAQSAGKDPSQYDQVADYLPGSTREYVNRVMLFKEQNSG